MKIPPILIVDETWKDKSKEHPKNLHKYFIFLRKKFPELGDGYERAQRVVRQEFKHLSIEDLEKLAFAPCMKHSFERGYFMGYEVGPSCTYCGAIESVYQYHKTRGYHYAGNGHLLPL